MDEYTRQKKKRMGSSSHQYCKINYKQNKTNQSARDERNKYEIWISELVQISFGVEFCVCSSNSMEYDVSLYHFIWNEIVNYALDIL